MNCWCHRYYLWQCYLLLFNWTNFFLLSAFPYHTAKPILCFMQREWGKPVCFLVQKCLPSSVTFLQFVLTPSSSLPKTLICSSFPNTLVSGVGRLMFEGLRLHCPLPTELSLLYWLCPLPRSDSWCNRNDFFIDWLFPTFIEVFFFQSFKKIRREN